MNKAKYHYSKASYAHMYDQKATRGVLPMALAIFYSQLATHSPSKCLNSSSNTLVSDDFSPYDVCDPYMEANIVTHLGDHML